jgi:hypothetical protein
MFPSRSSSVQAAQQHRTYRLLERLLDMLSSSASLPHFETILLGRSCYTGSGPVPHTAHLKTSNKRLRKQVEGGGRWRHTAAANGFSPGLFHISTLLNMLETPNTNIAKKEKASHCKTCRANPGVTFSSLAFSSVVEYCNTPII